MKRSAMKGLGLWLLIGCAYLPAPAPDWIEAETTVARRGVVAVGEAAAAEGIAGADMVAASQLAGALDAWLAPALTLLEPDVAKEIFVQVALVASVNDRWVDPADGSHFSRIVLRWEDVDKVIRRALHGDERLEQVLEALPGKLKEGTKMTARAPDWMQLKWSQVPEGMRRELPLSHVIEAKDNGVNEASKEDKEDLDEDLELMDGSAATSGGQRPVETATPPAAAKPTARPNAPTPKATQPKASGARKSKAKKAKDKRSLIKRKAQPKAIPPGSSQKSAAPDAKENE